MIKTIYLAGGCFWGVQHYFDQFDGILKTIVGYANGKTQNPEYKDVKAGLTGHAETLEIQYDDKMISLSKILDLYFDIIDPVSVNQQGEDIGISYRTGIYYVEKTDLETIQSKYNEIQKKYDSPLAVEVEPMKNFFNAEEYHQKYLDKNPGAYCHIPASKFKKGLELAPSFIVRPATYPVVHAICRLYPPVCASKSKTSPINFKPLIFLVSIV